MKLRFKLRAGTSAAGLRALHEALAKHGAVMQRLFPDQADDELASLHTVDVPDETTGKRVLALLKQAPAVEFAEPEARRRLIR